MGHKQVPGMDNLKVEDTHYCGSRWWKIYTRFGKFWLPGRAEVGEERGPSAAAAVFAVIAAAKRGFAAAGVGDDGWAAVRRF
mmetsp:Transcript_15352/g.32802  ORF Transcript_15352/g.32802 Transcript_15352/m.32802 type:complete len:82 (-) Transcript_15352:178-423(-)